MTEGTPWHPANYSNLSPRGQCVPSQGQAIRLGDRGRQYSWRSCPGVQADIPIPGRCLQCRQWRIGVLARQDTTNPPVGRFSTAATSQAANRKGTQRPSDLQHLLAGLTGLFNLPLDPVGFRPLADVRSSLVKPSLMARSRSHPLRRTLATIHEMDGSPSLLWWRAPWTGRNPRRRTDSGYSPRI